MPQRAVIPPPVSCLIEMDLGCPFYPTIIQSQEERHENYFPGHLAWFICDRGIVRLPPPPPLLSIKIVPSEFRRWSSVKVNNKRSVFGARKRVEMMITVGDHLITIMITQQRWAEEFHPNGGEREDPQVEERKKINKSHARLSVSTWQFNLLLQVIEFTGTRITSHLISWEGGVSSPEWSWIAVVGNWH